MTAELQHKIPARHLARNAYLYVRQSTVRQVFEHAESTKRQYALRQRAVARSAALVAYHPGAITGDASWHAPCSLAAVCLRLVVSCMSARAARA